MMRMSLPETIHAYNGFQHIVKPEKERSPRSNVRKTVAGKSRNRSVDTISTEEAKKDDLDGETSGQLNMDFHLQASGPRVILESTDEEQYWFDDELRNDVLATNEAYKKHYHDHKLPSLRETLVYGPEQDSYIT